jgi:hypothetical protein
MGLFGFGGGAEKPQSPEEQMMTPEQRAESDRQEVPPAVRAVMEKKEAGEELSPEEAQLLNDYEEGKKLQEQFGNQEV